MSHRIEKEYKVKLQSGKAYYLVGKPKEIRDQMERDDYAVDYMPNDPDMPDRVKSIRLHRIVIVVGDKQITLNPSGTKNFIKERYFVGKCSCRPVISETTSSLFIGGEDDCSVHGFGRDDD